MAQYLQEPSANGAARLIAAAVQVCELASRYPAIFEHLTETSWPSGKARTTSTLLSFAEDGMVKLNLHDRSAGRSLWVSGDSWDAAMQGLEQLLESGKGEWRKDRAFKK